MSDLPPGFRVVQQPQQQTAQPNRAPGVIHGAPEAPKPPDPYKIERDGRSDFEDTRDTVSSLRKEFRSLPTFQAYDVALGAFNSSLTTKPNAQGDQSLITSYAKMLDPTSAVREGEFATTASTENTLNQIKARLAKEFGFKEGGMLSPEGRRFVRQEMWNLVNERFRPAYETDRRDYEALAERYGYDPLAIIGTERTKPYQANIDAFLNPKPKEPTRRDQAPQGYETGFDKFGRDDSFDRVRALQERYNITPEGESRLVGLLNANRGNPEMTMDELLRIYETAEIPPPEGAELQDLLEQMRGNTIPASAIDTSALEQEYKSGLDQVLDAKGEDPGSDTAAVVYGGARGATFSLNDEITGIGAAIGGTLSGENPMDSYRIHRDLVRRQTERTREESPYLSYGSEIGGAILTGGRLIRGAGTARDAAKVGAVEGGVYGYGEGKGLADSTVKAGIGTAGGALVGAGFQAGVNKIGNALGTGKANALADPEQVRTVQGAAERLNLTDNVRRADIDPAARGKRAELMQTDSRQALREAEGDDLEAMEGALLRELGAETAEGAGETFGRGERIQTGVKSVVTRAREKAGRLYDQARGLSRGLKVEPKTALRVVDEQIAELEAAGKNSNSASINYLKGVRDDLAENGGVGIDLLRGQRTNLRGNISASNLSMTDTERRVGIVLDALSEDIKIALKGNPALGKFREADEIWRKQADFQNNIVKKLVGTDSNPVPAEVAAKRVQAFVGGDLRRAKALLDELPPDAQRAIREQVAVSLGRSRNGDFSVAHFLTHTGNGQGSLLQEKTARAIFGEDGMRAINDLRILAQAKKDAADPSNYSNTGNLVQRAKNTFRRMMLGAFGFGAAIDAGGGAGVGTLAAGATTLGGEFVNRLGQQRAMRLLLNPDFTGLLKKLPNNAEPAAIDGWFGRLRAVAAKTPGMVADVQALERIVLDVANDNTSRLAAEPEGADHERRGQ